VFTDDDCEVRPDWLRAMTVRLRETPGAVMTGRVDPGGEGHVASVTEWTESVTYTRPSLKEDLLFTGNMGCAVETFSRVGPFDEREFLRFAEDNDWGYRALRAGLPIIFCPEAAVTHLDWRAPEELLRTYADYARCQGGFYGKYLRRGDAFIALRVGVTLLRGSRRWVTGLIRGDRVQRRNGALTVTKLLPGILAGIRGSS
jgi:GT2 family glycosyltransferase